MIINKLIEGFEGYYIYTDGKVWSEKFNKFVGHTRKNGYRSASLCKDGKYKQFFIHRLVLQAFISNPHNKPFCNHKDNNRTNNNINNLEWVTHQENTNHKTNQNRQSQGSNRPNSKLTELDIPVIRQMLEDGVCQKDIAKQFNVCQQVISSIKHKITWCHI